MCAAKLEAVGLLMPKATAVWLVDNTVLTFEQIASFTGMHAIEVQALADGEVGRGIVGRNPVEHEEIVQEELDKAIKDDSYIMKLAKSNLPKAKIRSKGPKYTPVSKRGDKPDAISYLVKHHPEITDAQIGKLIGTTKPTIAAVRDRSHASSSTIKPRHPVDLGLCTYTELEAAIDKGLRAQGKDPEEIKKQKAKMLEQQQQQQEQENNMSQSNSDSAFDFSNFTSNVQS